MGKKDYKTIILMGIQGSGKGTQAEMLRDNFGYEIIEMGGIFRAEAEKNTPLGKKIDQLINKEGKLVPDEIVMEVIKNRFKQLPSGQKVIIDGCPRTQAQKTMLEEVLGQVERKDFLALYVAITDEEAVKRLSRRQICKDCKTVHVAGEYDQCKKCGGQLIQREDDMPDKINTRLSWTHENVDPIIEEYKKAGQLIEVDGMKSIDEVYQDILLKLDIK